jgi:sugar lactone lactonase YvrE
VVAIDPATGQPSAVLNSFFILRFNSPDEITFIKRWGKAIIFFTGPAFSNLLKYSLPADMPHAVWRFDAQLTDLQAGISRSNISAPNGVASNADGTKLYATDTPPDFTSKGCGHGRESSGSPAIFVYDKDADLQPANKRIFGIARSGFSG